MGPSKQTEYLNICHVREGFNCCQLELDVPLQRGNFIVVFNQVASSKKFHSVIWSVSFFLFLCHYQCYKAVPDASEMFFLSCSLYNRFACLSCVSCSSKQKPKWGLRETKLWKRTRWWIVSNKNLLGIYLWWVYILCFLKFSVSCHANSVPFILEFWSAFACLRQGLCCYTTD